MDISPQTSTRPLGERHFVVQLSDLHVTAEGHLNGLVDTLEVARGILASLEEEGLPDAVLLTGDLADKGEPAAYERLRAVIDGFAERTAIPVIAMPGNHDRRTHGHL